VKTAKPIIQGKANKKPFMLFLVFKDILFFLSIFSGSSSEIVEEKALPLRQGF